MALNVGELYAELRLDSDQFTRGLQDGRRELDSLGTAAQRAAQVAANATGQQVQQYARLSQAANAAANEARAAHQRTAQAAEQVEAAERALQAARNGGGANGIARAEERVLAARRDQAQASDEVARSVGRMEAANRAAAQAAGRIDFERIRREAEQAGDSARRIELPGGLSGAADAAAGALGRLGDRAQGIGERAGGNLGGGILGGVSGAVSSLGTKAGPIGMALAGIAAVGLGAGAVLAGAIANGMQQEADLAKVQAGLGVDDETMRAIGNAASRAYTSGWGESKAENAEVISEAIKAGMLSTDDSGAQMQATAEQLQLLASVMDEDVSAAARAAGQAIKTGLVKDGTEAIDLLVKAEQSGLNVADDMLDTTIEYGTQFRQVGLSGAEAFALMNQAVENGARDADTAADAIKEFAIRSIDGSKASAEAYAALNLDAEEYTKRIAKGGTDARDAMAEIMRAMSGLDSEVDKNAVAVGLFGTKAEDLGQAMFAMNLDTAVEQFGEVEGAARRAGETIQNTTAAKMEQASRSIETSMAGVQASLAEAFGPTLTKVAEWVENHKPEIIGFFGDLADGAFATLDGIAAFASGTLNYFATMAEGSAHMFGSMLDSLGGLSSGIGSVLKHIPGFEGLGTTLEGVGGALKTYDDKMVGAAANMRGWADSIDTKVRPGLAGMRDLVAANTREAENSALMFRALGDEVEAVPTEHGIAINTNQPEVINALEALNLKTRTLEDGTVEVYADTAAGQQIINDFVASNQGRSLDMYVDVTTRKRNAGVADNAYGPYLDGGGAYADGAVRLHSFAGGGARLPEQAVIERTHGERGLVQWAENETGGEAFIPLAPGKRPRSLRILAETAARMGMAVVPRGTEQPLVGLMLGAHRIASGSYADGGIRITDQSRNNAEAFAKAQDDLPYTYGGASGSAWDCSGIHSGIYNELTGQDVRFTTDSDFAALGFERGYDPNGYSIGTNGGSGANGHMAGTLFGVNVESSSSNGVQYGGPALGAQDFDDVWHLPGAARNGGDDPSTEQVADLEARLAAARDAEKNATSDTERTAAGAKVAELEQALAAAKAGSSSGSKGSGQPVYVTNWPSGLSGGTSSGTSSGTASSSSSPASPAEDTPEPHDISTAAGRASLARAIGGKFFANGGFGGVGGENHSAHLAPAGSWRVFAEPETGGEAYIPLSPAKRNTSLAVWAQTGQRLGAFAVGAGLAAASGFDGDGNYVGFSTGDNSPASLQGALDRAIEYLQQIADAEQKPAVHIEHAEITDPQEFLTDATAKGGDLLALIQKGL